MTKKLAELEFKEKELIRQKRQLDEKEERLNKLDFEIKEKSRELTLKQESIVQNAELTRRKFEADYQIEVIGDGVCLIYFLLYETFLFLVIL